MGLFGRNKIIDLTEDYREQRKVRTKEGVVSDSSESGKSKSQESSSGNFFNFFGNTNSSSSSNSSSPATAGDIENIHEGNFDPETGKPLDPNEKRKRLARRLKNMTDRIEEQSNQIYLLQQRIDLLEKKMKIGKYSEEA